jgi:hypothetical protein
MGSSSALKLLYTVILFFLASASSLIIAIVFAIYFSSGVVGIKSNEGSSIPSGYSLS